MHCSHRIKGRRHIAGFSRDELIWSATNSYIPANPIFLTPTSGRSAMLRMLAEMAALDFLARGLAGAGVDIQVMLSTPGGDNILLPAFAKVATLKMSWGGTFFTPLPFTSSLLDPFLVSLAYYITPMHRLAHHIPVQMSVQVCLCVLMPMCVDVNWLVQDANCSVFNHLPRLKLEACTRRNCSQQLALSAFMAWSVKTKGAVVPNLTSSYFMDVAAAIMSLYVLVFDPTGEHTPMQHVLAPANDSALPDLVAWEPFKMFAADMAVILGELACFPMLGPQWFKSSMHTIAGTRRCTFLYCFGGDATPVPTWDDHVHPQTDICFAAWRAYNNMNDHDGDNAFACYQATIAERLPALKKSFDELKAAFICGTELRFCYGQKTIHVSWPGRGEEFAAGGEDMDVD